MIYNIPHVRTFGSEWTNLKIQWETVHLYTTPHANKGRGIGYVFFDTDWMEYIRAMNTPEAFQWMIGEGGTIIWGIKNKKNIGAKENKPRFPVIAIGGNQIWLVNQVKNFAEVVGMKTIDYTVTPESHPYFWHRIWCVTKQRKAISPPHDTPRGAAYLPIINPNYFRASKSLAAGVLYCQL